MNNLKIVACAIAIFLPSTFGMGQSSPGNSAGKASLARDPIEKMVINQRPETDADKGPQVRIAIKFTKLKPNGTDKRGQIKFAAGDIKRHVLRARLNKINHFYLDNYHVETKPISLVKASNQVRMRLTISRTHANEKKMEELLGSIEVAGKLHKTGENLYMLRGEAGKRLLHPSGQPMVDVVAGFRASEGPGVAENRPKPSGRAIAGKESSVAKSVTKR
jgi:hypothetical protein